MYIDKLNKLIDLSSDAALWGVVLGVVIFMFLKIYPNDITVGLIVLWFISVLLLLLVIGSLWVLKALYLIYKH